MSEKGFTIAIYVGLALISIVFVIYFFFSWNSGTGVFAPYHRPDPPTGLKAFYPLGTVTPLTPEEIKLRNEIITASRSTSI